MINKTTHITKQPKSTSSSHAAGRKRDSILSEVLAKSTLQFLQRSHFQPGMMGLDLGCGIGDVTSQLKSMIGAKGEMTGIDADSTNVNIATERIARQNQSEIRFLQKDISEWDESAQYDFVYSRLLFNQITNPAKLVQRIYQSLKKGGWVMIEDMDMSNFHCYPSCYALERYVELDSELKNRQGADAHIGSKLGSLLGSENFQHVQVVVVKPAFLNAESKRIPSLSLENIFDALLTQQLATNSELQALLFELNDFENRPDTLITLPGIYQVVGYR